MKGKNHVLWGEMQNRLWNASSDGVWKWWLSFSTSFITLLLYSTFPNLWSSTDPVAAQTWNYEEDMYILPVHCHFSYPFLYSHTWLEPFLLIPGNSVWVFTLREQGVFVNMHILNVVQQWGPLRHLFWPRHRGSRTPVYVVFYAVQPCLQHLAVFSLWKFV